MAWWIEVLRKEDAKVAHLADGNQTYNNTKLRTLCGLKFTAESFVLSYNTPMCKSCLRIEAEKREKFLEPAKVSMRLQ